MTKFKKGYTDDIGIDICLDFAVEFAPFETKVIDIGISLPTCIRQAIMMCARTSAAKRGIIVNQCPIDPNYQGNAHIIAHNCSNKSVKFMAEEAFAQLFVIDVQPIGIDYEIKRAGYRYDNNFGSTDD